MKKTICLLITLASSLVWANSDMIASDDFNQISPALSHQPKRISREGFRYAIVNAAQRAFVDIENQLTSLGLKIQSCSLVKKDNNMRIDYKKISHCLVHRLLMALDNPSDEVLIYFWTSPSKDKLIPAQIDWHPTDEGWFSFLSEVLKLRTEWAREKWSQFFSGKDDELHKLNFKRGIIGTMVIRTQKGVVLNDLFEANQKKLPVGLKQLQITIIPIGIRSNYIEYNVRIIGAIVNDSNGTESQLDVQILTNINPTRTERKFNLTIRGKDVKEADIGIEKIPRVLP